MNQKLKLKKKNPCFDFTKKYNLIQKIKKVGQILAPDIIIISPPVQPVQPI